MKITQEAINKISVCHNCKEDALLGDSCGIIYKLEDGEKLYKIRCNNCGFYLYVSDRPLLTHKPIKYIGDSTNITKLLNSIKMPELDTETILVITAICLWSLIIFLLSIGFIFEYIFK